MLGLLVIIIVSWVLLRFIQRTDLEALGIIPNTKRLVQFSIGFAIITIISLLMIYIETIVLSVKWQFNQSIEYVSFLHAFIYHIKSALTEDLVFRGAILYILIQRIGTQKALILSALFFGIYHVFSYGMLESNLLLIVFIIITTGLTGYVWAYTFAKTNSIMMALGFHIGWNLVQTCFFKSQPYGELLFSEISKIQLVDWDWLLFATFKGLLPSILTFFFVKQYLRKKAKINKLKS